jgi:hypothetical protein
MSDNEATVCGDPVAVVEATPVGVMKLDSVTSGEPTALVVVTPDTGMTVVVTVVTDTDPAVVVVATPEAANA